ncbi:MAG: Gfo/Idh/MocA family oxidoreductase [Capsulimonadaceae bacterium]|nr:Gfo/Idh/MocA family oxidoreductase [Capsulimonadaceae bacterium]
MATEGLRIGIIGAGGFARTHFILLSRMPDVHIVAACDTKENALRVAVEEFAVPGRYNDYRKLLEEADVDAVYVAVSPRAMFGITMDVIASGKHVFAEKPLGSNIEQTRALVAAAETAGIKTAVGVNRRYCAVIRKAKEVVEQRGPISGVLGEFHKNCAETLYGMSILHCDGLHALDALRYIGGDVASVHAQADRWYRSSGWEGLNNVFHAMIRFESGASGIFIANRQGGARREYFEIHGSDISAYIYTPNRAEIYRAGVSRPEIIRGEELTGSSDPLVTYGYEAESRDFIDAILNDGVSQTNFADNLKTMLLCDQINAGDHVERVEAGR